MSAPALRGLSAEHPFEICVAVAAEDLDERAHVNNVVYLRWVQDVAIAHWQAAAPPGAVDDIAWVALRHEIDYLLPAVLGDRLVVRTWVGPASGVKFERMTELRREGDGQVVARARTLWCPIDARTGAVRRVPPAIRALFSAPTPPAG